MMHTIGHIALFIGGMVTMMGIGWLVNQYMDAKYKRDHPDKQHFDD